LPALSLSKGLSFTHSHHQGAPVKYAMLEPSSFNPG
jgi:hypothetical protein